MAPRNDRAPTVRWAPGLRADLLATLRAMLPAEGAALLGGRRTGDDLQVTAIEPLRARATANEFAVDAAAFAQGLARLEPRAPWLGFAHSHPHGAPVPSAQDRAQLWPRCLQVIVGPLHGTARIAAFWLDGDGARELAQHEDCA